MIGAPIPCTGNLHLSTSSYHRTQCTSKYSICSTRVSLHGISCVKKIQLMLHEGSKAALKVHKSLFFFAAHVSPEPHRASCQTVDQQCPGKQPQAPSTKLSSHFGNSNVKCNRLAVVPYSYRIWPDQFLQPPDGHRMQAMPYLADLEVFHRESKMQDLGFKKKLYISRAHRMLANSQSFGQLGWGTACPKTNLPKGSSSFQIHRSRWKISSELMAPPGRLKGIPWQQELQTSDLIVWQLPKNISPRNASVCSSWENQDLGCLEEGCFAAQRKEGNVEPKPFETLRKPGYGLHSFVQS